METAETEDSTAGWLTRTAGLWRKTWVPSPAGSLSDREILGEVTARPHPESGGVQRLPQHPGSVAGVEREKKAGDQEGLCSVCPEHVLASSKGHAF